MTRHACPTRDRIGQFCRGLLAEDDKSKITDHLESCDACAAAAAECEREMDSFAALLRAPAVASESADDSCYEFVQARVKRFDFDADTSSTNSHLGLPPLTQLRDYRLIRKLGEGGMGTVYQALHTRLDRVVALKVLPPERMQNAQAIARFQQEMRAIGALDHPAIVRATDAGDVDSTHFLVMEFVEGLDLARLCRRMGQLPIAEACEIIRQAAVGLQHVHEQGMVHRDIKPSNLMLNPQAQVKVLDLGLALLQHQTGDAHELTTLGQFLGTLDYMSPEQADDSHDVDRRTDIYGLGATLYRMLAGMAPYAGREFNSPIKKIKGLALAPVPPIREQRPEIPEALAELIERMLAKAPSDRPGSVEEVVAELEPFADGADLAALLANAEAIQDDSARENNPSEPAVVPRSAGGLATAAAPLQNGAASGSGRFRSWLALAAFGFISLLAAGITIYIKTDTGELVINAEADAEVLVKKSGKVVEDWELSQGKNRTTLRSGSYEIVLTGDTDGLKVTNNRFELTRNGRQIATIERVRGAPSAARRPNKSQEPTYDGKSFQEWTRILQTERSPDVVNDTVHALSALADENTGGEAVELILSHADRFGDPWANEATRDSIVRGSAVVALRRIAHFQSGLKSLENVLETGTSKNRTYMLQALSNEFNRSHSHIGKVIDAIPRETARAAIPAIIAASRDDDARVRKFAIQTAAEIDIESRQLNDRAAALLNDDDIQVVVAAVTLLLDAAAKKPANARNLPEAIDPALIRIFKTKNTLERQLAFVDKVHEVAPDRDVLVPLLVALTEQDSRAYADWNFRRDAIARLGGLGVRARPAIPTLTKLLKLQQSYSKSGRESHISSWELGTPFGKDGGTESARNPLRRPATIALLVLATIEAIGPAAASDEHSNELITMLTKLSKAGGGKDLSEIGIRQHGRTVFVDSPEIRTNLETAAAATSVLKTIQEPIAK